MSIIIAKKETLYLTKHLQAALKKSLFDFKEKRNFQKRGIYFIYRGSKIIYVGKTTRAGNKRLSEIAHHYKSHTLHRKLLREELEKMTGKDFKKFKRETETIFIKDSIVTIEQLAIASDAVRKHIRGRLKFRFYEFENPRLTSLEHFAIAVLNPKYND